MKRKEIRREMQILTSQLDVVLEKLNEQYFLITEKHGSDSAELLIEGFWDTLKKGAANINQAAHTVGKVFGKGVSAVKGAGSWLWEKGKELGQDAVNIINKLGDRIATYIKDAYNWVISAPGKFIEKMQSMWNDLKTNLQSLKKSAGEKWNEVIKIISDNITKKIIEPFKAKWAEFQKNYGESKKAMQTRAAEFKQMGDDFAKSGKENLIKIGNAIKSGIESAAFFALGLVLLPFYLVFKGTEYLYTVGENVVANIKQNAPEVWNTLQIRKEFKAGYAEGTTPKTPTTESKILDFGSFMIKRS